MQLPSGDVTVLQAWLTGWPLDLFNTLKSTQNEILPQQRELLGAAMVSSVFII